MIEVWRLAAPAYADAAFSGEGARLWGGRWGSEGRRLVYTSGSLALALLEVLAGAGDRRRLQGYLAFSASFDERHLETLDEAALPVGWDARPYTGVSQAVGDQWLDERRSLALRVPSVVVPTEWNALLNPEHPAFGEIVSDPPVAAPFDPRLLR